MNADDFRDSMLSFPSLAPNPSPPRNGAAADQPWKW